MLTVFAGAGASCAVKDEQYPTTSGFFERLPAQITADRLFAMLAQRARQQFETSDLDIEQILWCLQDLQNVLVPLRDESTTPGWFARQERLGHVLGRASANTAAAFQIMFDVAGEGDALASRIYKQVFELYGTAPSPEDLEPNWTRLLQGIGHFGQPCELFTTNYDVVIEEAIRLSNLPFATGRTSETLPRLDENFWAGDDLRIPGHIGALTKLHGSVDWSWGAGDRISVGTPTWQGIHDRHVIIYPGFKEAPSRSPFGQFHSRFEQSLRNTRVAVFIGYSFRDGYINQLIQRNLSPGARIVVIDLSSERVQPVLQGKDVLYIGGGFKADAVRDTLSAIEAHLPAQNAV